MRQYDVVQSHVYPRPMHCKLIFPCCHDWASMHGTHAHVFLACTEPHLIYLVPPQAQPSCLMSSLSATPTSARGPSWGARSQASTLPRSLSTSTCCRCRTTTHTYKASSTRGRKYNMAGLEMLFPEEIQPSSHPILHPVPTHPTTPYFIHHS